MVINELNQLEPDLMSSEIEVDKSYFRGRRKGKRGRGAGGKVPMFGLLKRNGQMHVMIIFSYHSRTNKAAFDCLHR